MSEKLTVCSYRKIDIVSIDLKILDLINFLWLLYLYEKLLKSKSFISDNLKKFVYKNA